MLRYAAALPIRVRRSSSLGFACYCFGRVLALGADYQGPVVSREQGCSHLERFERRINTVTTTSSVIHTANARRLIRFDRSASHQLRGLTP